MKNYKYFAIPIWQIINIICVLLYIYNILYVGEVVLCDSIECINDFVADTTQDDDLHSLHPTTGLFFRFKRKLSWYINGKKSGNYNSYSEFKDRWNPNTSLWNIVKADFKSAHKSASKNLNSSLKQDSSVIEDVRSSRANKDIANQVRRNIANTK